MQVLELLHLRKHFGRVRAVDDVSFKFGSGEVYGFVGPNGAAKSTTMRILATLDEPTSGDALVDGLSVVEEPEKIRKLVGYVPDSLPAHRDMSVHEYVDFFARAYGIKTPRRHLIVEQIKEFTSLTSIRDRRLMALSKGMKQRVSLARALVHDPAVLILDEPAAGLDPRARIELRELLKTLAKQGKAILISSHILTELSEFCTGTVIIERGKVLRAGSVDEIIKGDSPHRRVHIRVLDNVAGLLECVLKQPGVESARSTGDHAVEVALEGGEEASCALLAFLVRENLQIVEFRQARADLEQVFLDVTKGEIQ